MPESRIINKYEITPEGLEWCSDECIISTAMVEVDEVLNQLKSTYIWDNHQGWFNDDGVPFGIQHPRFETLYRQQDIDTKLMHFGLLLTIPFFVTAIAPNLVRDFYGLGYVLPSPFVRTYIQNPSDKIGLAPPHTIFNTFNELPSPYDNDPLKYNNICYAHSFIKKGYDIDDPTFTFYSWIKENRPLKTAYQFNSEIAEFFNCYWGVLDYDNSGIERIVLQPKAWFENKMPILYDFNEDIDKEKLVDNICFAWDENKLYAGIEGVYTTDGNEYCGDLAIDSYNDVEVYNDFILKNRLDGINVISSEFAPVIIKESQRVDREISDYLWKSIGFLDIFVNAVTVAITVYLLTLNLITGGAVGIALFSSYLINRQTLLNWNGDYRGIVIGSRQWEKPKLLDYDTSTPLDRAQVKYTLENTLIDNPHVTPDYLSWGQKPGNTTPLSVGGGAENYSLEFETSFAGSLYDHFWQREDPLYYYKKNGTFDLKIKLCCEDVDKLKLIGSGNARMYYRVGLYKDTNNEVVYGYITKINITFAENYIQISGKI